MAKKNLFLLSAIILIFSLTACSAIQLPWANATTSSTQTSSLANFASQPVKNKLAVGVLELEGSDLAQNERVTAAIPTGAPQSGAKIPAKAVVFGESEAWVYVQTAAQTFVRTRVDVSHP